MQTMANRKGEPYGEMSRIHLPAAGAYATEFTPEFVFEAMTNASSRNIERWSATARTIKSGKLTLRQSV